MTQEEKQLLLKDLCARLPYGVICRLSAKDVDVQITEKLELGGLEHFIVGTMDIKPYLRPLSSMTEDEKAQLKQEHMKDTRLHAEALTMAAAGDNSMLGKAIPHFASDWCNKNHFDYRGLIEKGLAIEAPKDMYKTE